MKYIILTAVTALAVGAGVSARAANDAVPNSNAPAIYVDARPDMARAATLGADGTDVSLKALLAEWDRAGFDAPGKPGQSRVYRRNGYVTTGGGYNVMASLIRSAVTDVRAGRDADAAPKIAKARLLLTASNLRKG